MHQIGDYVYRGDDTMASTTASVCADALVTHWISRFGVPAHLTSDRGPQFVSALWDRLCTFVVRAQQLFCFQCQVTYQMKGNDFST